MTDTTVSPTSDEKMMAAIAHLFGPLGAIIVWAIQREKSRFVKFQSLQALAFDGIAMITMAVFFFCFFIIAFLGMSGFMVSAMNDPSSQKNFGIVFGAPFIFQFAIIACIFPISFLLLCVRFIAVISVLNGKAYHYPVLGAWIEKFLEGE